MLVTLFYLQTGSGNPLLTLAPILLVFGIFYFVLFMPMQRQRKQQQKMLAELRNGDTVVTTGGVIGTITAIDNDTLVLRVRPDNLKLQFSRSAVASLVAAPESASKQ